MAVDRSLTVLVTAKPSATLNVQGPVARILPENGFGELVPSEMQATAAGVGSETVTVTLTAKRRDGTTATTTGTATANGIITPSLNVATLSKAGTYITEIDVTVASSINTSTSSVAVLFQGLEFAPAGARTGPKALSYGGFQARLS